MIDHDRDTGNGAMALSAGLWLSVVVWGIIILVWRVLS